MSELVEAVNWVKVAACVSAGFCMGIGTLGPALGQGYIGGKACENLGKRPESAGVIFRTMMAGMAFTETSSIYALIVALVLLFVMH